MRLVFVRQFALDNNNAVALNNNDIWDTVARALIVFEIEWLIVEKVVSKGF